MPQNLGVSLFTGAGIGDVGLRSAGVKFVLLSELEAKRADLATINFPEAKTVVGDIWDTWQEIVDLANAESTSADEEIFLVTCTAPCQGMSKSGQGKLLSLIRKGERPKLDPRNRLILPALEAIRELSPKWVLFENVSEMATTLIEDQAGHIRPILEVIRDALGPLGYEGRPYDVEFADYGIPQRRRRLLTIYSRTGAGKAHLRQGGEFLPPPTHSSDPNSPLPGWVSVWEAISDFPPLDAATEEGAQDQSVPFHRVPLLDERKYEWVSHTPPSRSAFDNQCKECGHAENTTHSAERDRHGINRAKTTTPIFCEECGSLLPRPHVLDEDGQPRIMKGYTSAYKRMPAGLPAAALTRNLSYACSDQKLHPYQHRVLSLAEAFRVHTLDQYDYGWGPVGEKGRTAPDSLIRLVLGESIPPKITELVGRHIVAIEGGGAI